MANAKSSRRAPLKSKKVVFLNKATDRVSIDRALQIACSVIPLGSRDRSLFAQVLSSDPVTEKEVTLTRMRSRLLDFCRDGVVRPTKGNESREGVCYEGDVEQDRLFSISVGEFASFLKTFCMNVRIGDDLGLPSCNLTGPDVKQAVSVRFAKDTPDLYAPDDDDYSLWDPDDSEMDVVKRGEDNKKQNQIPGKLPRTAVGRLAVKTAWDAEVDTGQKIGPKEIMERLCDKAAKDRDKDCLIRCIERRPDYELVEWRTDEGDAKKFSRDDCKKVVRKWRVSISQRKSATKVVERKKYRVRLRS